MYVRVESEGSGVCVLGGGVVDERGGQSNPLLIKKFIFMGNFE